MTTEKHKCCGTVFDRGWPHPCSKTAKVERSGKWYCGIHDPVAREEKQKKQHAKWAEQWAKEREEAEALAKAKKQKEHRAACFPELLEALKVIAQYWDDVVPPMHMNEMHKNAKAVIAKAEGAA